MSKTSWTMRLIKQANKAAGLHWFDDDTMSFFDSYVYPEVFEGVGGIFFVSSERCSMKHSRLYSLRSFDAETGDVDTVGAFQCYTTMARACRDAQLAAEGKKI